MAQVAPFGSWKSPISSDLIAAGSVGLGQIILDGDDVYWIEARSAEAGRVVIVRRTPDGRIEDVNPPPFNARTRVHEYGGGGFAVDHGTVYFANYADQRLYKVEPGSVPSPLTPEGAWRYADLLVDRSRGLIYCVCEDHTSTTTTANGGQGSPVNGIASIPLAGGSPRMLAAHHDFCSSIRLSPDGARLAWLCWDHPNMPWDGTQLYVARIRNDGSLQAPTAVAGDATGEESIFQPEWAADGVPTFVSDRTGWWNLYHAGSGAAEPICPKAAEFGMPQWVFGMSTYAFTGGERGSTIVCAYCEVGTWRLGIIDPSKATLEPLELPYTSISGLRAAGGSAYFVGASPTEPAAIVRLDLGTHEVEVLRRSSDIAIDLGYVSTPQPIEFPTDKGRTAHGLFYPPQNADFASPVEERPPLLVMSHGGPTSASQHAFRPSIQYWTSRGIAVLDVNYGGSTGYGRAYRSRLNGEWGIVDVGDCANGARYLVEQGLVDGARLAITGGSAGGYTTLTALTSTNVFAAGASHYGVSDLEALALDTHKFESRYLDRLIGPYPERRDLYVERSPINHTDRLSSPMIVLQGLEDKIVPPNQAEMMVEALRKKGLPVAYITFEGEQHGFRRAENIKRALDAELYFYSRIFGFELAEPVDPVPIENFN